MERKAEQQELSKRATDQLPFRDDRLIRHAIQTIYARLTDIKKGSGEIIYSSTISFREEQMIRSKLSGLGNRLTFISGIRLAEGAGTLIEVREKR